MGEKKEIERHQKYITSLLGRFTFISPYHHELPSLLNELSINVIHHQFWNERVIFSCTIIEEDENEWEGVDVGKT